MRREDMLTLDSIEQEICANIPKTDRYRQAFVEGRGRLEASTAVSSTTVTRVTPTPVPSALTGRKPSRKRSIHGRKVTAPSFYATVPTAAERPATIRTAAAWPPKAAAWPCTVAERPATIRTVA
ncbi:hypothetical protein QQP08_008168 [Theobroma cacao]|nr:hypothetical protein QQP08_008168 [Theobroma cacao]